MATLVARRPHPRTWLLLLACVSTCAWSAPEQTDRDAATASVVGVLLQHNHYAPQAIDDALSRQWLDAYLSALDPNHMILLAQDVTEIRQKWATRLDDDIQQRAPTLTPMTEIYARYEQRLSERLAGARNTLAGPLPLDTQETWDLDRDKAPWPATAAEADALWRCLILDQVVRAVLLAEQKAAEAPAGAPTQTPEAARQAAITETVARMGKRFDRLAERSAKTSHDDVLEGYLDALTTLYDPHTQYFAPATNSNFTIEVNNAVQGIGARLRSEDDATMVEALVAGGPAALDGRLRPGDQIVAVAQGDEPFVDIVGMRLDDVVALIRGQKGTPVRLMVIPVDAPDHAATVEIALLRAEVVLTESQASASVLSGPPGAPTLGYIDLPSFYSDFESSAEAGVRRGATTDVQRLLGELQAKHVDGVILDLRENGGGALREAVDLTGLFIDQGPVVQVRGGDGAVDVLSDEAKGRAWDGPLLVLTSPLSASASEIVAGALQDYGRALVVGAATTHGKGSVQQVMELGPVLERIYRQPASDRTASLKITTQQFYRVTGSSTQNRGVALDLVLPSPWQGLPISESDLPHALPWSQIDPAEATKAGSFQAVLPELSRRSAARVAASPDFQSLLGDLAARDATKDADVISLNLDKRRAELAALSNQDVEPDRPLEGVPSAEERAAQIAKDYILQESAAILRDVISLGR